MTTVQGSGGRVEVDPDMPAFVEDEVDDPLARARLGDAISDRGAFRRFGSILRDYPEPRGRGWSAETCAPRPGRGGGWSARGRWTHCRRSRPTTSPAILGRARPERP
ncbi:MAG: hypothetical protein ACYC0W_04545 [Candidatus Nanopelagicales bacterium]